MDSDSTTGRLESTISSLREGAMQLALEKGREEVAGWRQALQNTGEQELTPVADNLAALETELSRSPVDGAIVGRLMRTLAVQTREAASGDLVSGSDQKVVQRLESLAGLLENEGSSISDAG